ncbi:MAG TPA: quinolinate synthase NadA [bacterium]|nr:quinolinate synthase NadA [bacterium]HOL47708.1 quinolinate synthase NadA [bacterium]HPQ19070.1 quinolinate synthase NadA [bacterium]
MNTKNKIIEKILELKKKLNAVILVHYYQLGEVQEIADFIGDSLGLSLEAEKTNADVIIFCGVKFMAETAAIICPDKKVLLPDLYAGCPMAEMITREQLISLKDQYKDEDIEVVCYVNSNADVKAESTICCTSANSIKIVNSISPDKKIIFIPDKYLALYTERMTKRKFIIWNGYCPTHLLINKNDILNIKEKYPDAVVLAHPECSLEVQNIADVIASTGGMVNYVKNSNKKIFIIATENGLIYYLQKNFSDKIFLSVNERIICPNMKKIRLENVLWSMEEMRYEITVEDEIATKARKAIQRMLEISKNKG